MDGIKANGDVDGIQSPVGVLPRYDILKNYLKTF